MRQRTVVITGGTRGIGLDITEMFAKAGFYVVVGARREANIDKAWGDRVSFVPMDVRDESAHCRLAEMAMDKTGVLDAYVNNAGYSQWKPIEEIDEAFLSDIMATNLMGAFWGCKAASKFMKKGGGIINISSIAGKRGSSNNSAYCASKFGMNGLTQSLAKELGPRGIRVNALCPVLIPTEGLIDALNSPHAPAKGDPEGFISKFAQANAALGRLPTGSEVAKMALLLINDESSAITGQCMNVDCGVFPQ